MTEAPRQPESDEGLPPASPRRWLVPVLVGAAIIALVIVALLRGETSFDPTSPEGAVQEYLQALADGRWDDALDVLDPQIFETCRGSHIADYVWSSFSASHESTVHGPRDVYVNVTLEFGDGGVWGGWRDTTQFTLTEIDGLWYITDDPWPHFRDSCRRF